MTRKYLSPAAAMLLLATGSQAYELPVTCQSVGHWKVIEGQCGANGKLQGRGTAALNPEIRFTGEFVDGLPHGRHSMVGLNGRLHEGGLHAGQLHVGTRVRCEFDFENGQIRNSEFSCTFEYLPGGQTSNPPPPIVLKVKSGAGQVQWNTTDSRHVEGNPAYRGEGRGLLIVDLPTVEVSAQVHVQTIVPAADIAYANINHTGTADQLTMRFGQVRSRSISFDIANFDNTLAGDFTLRVNSLNETDSVLPLSLAGTFNWTCLTHSRDSCWIKPFSSPPETSGDLGLKAGKVDRRALIKLTTTNPSRQYEYVRPSNERYDNWPQRVLYFKKGGFEFDATGSDCMINERGASLIRVATPIKEFDVRPRCGKVTMPDGRSFDGKYDTSTGKPILSSTGS